MYIGHDIGERRSYLLGNHKSNMIPLVMLGNVLAKYAARVTWRRPRSCWVHALTLPPRTRIADDEHLHESHFHLLVGILDSDPLND